MGFRRVAAIYLMALLFFSWGVAAARYGVFPWSFIRSVQDFVRGDVNEDTTLAEKVMNDLDISPERFMRSYLPSDPARFHAVALDGIRDRRDAPRLWISTAAPKSYRLIVGAFDFEKAFWGAVLLDPSGRVARRWYMNEEIPDLTDVPDELKDLYGVAFLPDGSAIFTMQEPSGGIVKIDACSRVEWTKKGLFHHVIAPTDDYSAFWTFGGRQSDLYPKLVLIDATNGRTIKEIDMAQVQKANPGTYIFDLQRVAGTKHATHPNDIEPLPKALAGAYPSFTAGDLLISYNTTNLIFVLDPRTLKIKWWYVGAGDGQHDADWHEDGTISILNNNMRAEQRGAPLFSTIVSIDPATNTHRTVLDGKRFNFYSAFNGEHEFTDHGSVMVASSSQGRAFEVDLASGKKIFDFVNAYEWAAGRTLHLSDAESIDRDEADRWVSQSCSGETAWRGEQ